MSKIASSTTSEGKSHVTEKVTLTDGREGKGTKLIIFRIGPNDEDRHEARSRALQDALSKPLPKKS